jgi:hypothetical protein
MRLACCAALLSTLACVDVVTCDTVTDDIGQVCLPSALAPGIAPVIAVRESCGAGCSGTPSCTALFRDGQIVLDVTHDVCSDQRTTVCINQGCQRRVMNCQLPALNAGTYVLAVPGGPDQVLNVAAGGQSTCRFSLDGGVQ